MSTLASAALSSDDEGDADFQLPEPKSKGKSRKRPRANSSSGSSSSDSDDEVDTVDAIEARTLRAEQEATESEERRKRAAAAFEAMKNGAASTVDKVATSTAGPAMVEVKRARNFAGDTITETVILPADHPDAIAHLKQGSTSESAEYARLEEASRPQTAENSSVNDAGPSKPKSKLPPRRKPRQSLEAMSAALDKGKKMTTLEKSQMDWKNHTAGDRAIGDELEANRRAGGYLQKRDFLERVGERRMDTFEGRPKPR